jgi:hypothetical protein
MYAALLKRWVLTPSKGLGKVSIATEGEGFIEVH